MTDGKVGDETQPLDVSSLGDPSDNDDRDAEDGSDPGESSGDAATGKEADEEIDKTSEESFPASDPPAW
jgi:hypothetical protein